MILALLLLAAAPADPSATNDLPFHGEAKLHFATVEEGREILTRVDDYLGSLSRFDLEARLHTDQQATLERFQEFIGEQVVEWSDAERAKIETTVAAIRPKLDALQLDLPKPVVLVLTTGKEEAEAAYCRGTAIVLPRSMLGWTAPRLEKLFIHELFHVLSRNSPETRAKLYAIVGFRSCPEVALPEGWRERKITNPDGPKLDVCIELTVGDEKLRAVPVLFATPARFDVTRTDSFFKYMTFRLLVVDEHDGKWSPRLVEGAPVFLDPAETPDYAAQIGKNTKYIIHPDEVLADNFVHLVLGAKDLPTPRIVEEMGKALGKE